jgi:signal recognition particle receptor subunit beta
LRTFVLFVFGDFDDIVDIEFFCLNHIGGSEYVKEIKYVIQNLKNIIIIFDSDVEDEKLRRELFLLLKNENVMFYFIFDKDDVFLAHIPQNINEIIYKPAKVNDKIEASTMDTLDLDTLLEKIQTYGLDSLTIEEKKFLDSFNDI